MHSKAVSFRKMLGLDIKNILWNGKLILLLGSLAFGAAAMMTQIAWQDKDFAPTFLDYIIFAFEGCPPFSELKGGAFQIPIIWFILCYLGVYGMAIYPFQDLHGFGQQKLYRSPSRKSWWRCKCITIFIWITVYFFIGITVMFIFSVFTSGVCWMGIKTLYGAWALQTSFIWLPWLFELTLALLQLFLSVLSTPIIGQIAIICILVSSAFFDTPFLGGSYSMAIRNELNTEGGHDPIHGFLFFFVLIVFLVFLGEKLFSTLDIISRK